MRRRVGLGWFMLVLSMVGCGSGNTTGTAPATTSAVVGAWYGSGTEFPDDDLCLVFCANGRLFTGDRPCTETSASDFDTYLLYTFSDGQLEAQSSAGTIITGTVDVREDSATFTLTSAGATYTLPMARTASDSPLCARTDVTLRTGQ